MFTAGCQNKQKSDATDTDVAVADTVGAVADSTIYGVVGESGMSTLCIISNEGDTLFMEKDDEQGYGEMYGYVQEGDSFAVTKRMGEQGLVLVKAYNLTLLKRFGVNYAIHNGLFVVDGDTVTIKSLNDDSLVVESNATKKILSFPAKEK